MLVELMRECSKNVSVTLERSYQRMNNSLMEMK